MGPEEMSAPVREVIVRLKELNKSIKETAKEGGGEGKRQLDQQHQNPKRPWDSSKVHDDGIISIVLKNNFTSDQVKDTL